MSAWLDCDECLAGKYAEVAYVPPKSMHLPAGVEFVKSVCDACGAECVFPSQHDRNLTAMRE